MSRNTGTYGYKGPDLEEPFRGSPTSEEGRAHVAFEKAFMAVPGRREYLIEVAMKAAHAAGWKMAPPCGVDIVWLTPEGVTVTLASAPVGAKVKMPWNGKTLPAIIAGLSAQERAELHRIFPKSK